MAVRIDDDNGVIRTASLPHPRNFTMLGWCYLVNDRTSQWRYFANLESGTSDWMSLGFRQTDNVFSLSVSNSTEVTGFAQTPTNGYWFPWAVTSQLGVSPLAVVTGYWRNLGGNILKGIQSADTMNWTPSHMTFGTNNYGEWNNVRLGGIKVYQATLTQKEIEKEWQFYMPVRKDNLYAVYPLRYGDRITDYSGLKHNLTEESNLTDEPDPPISWQHQPSIMPPKVRSLEVSETRGVASLGGL